MKDKNLQNNRGFVILFAVTLSAIILSITLGLTNIAFKEIKFGTSAKDTNNAFYAADTGSECALINDKSTSTIFIEHPSTTTIRCNNNNINVTKNLASSIWKFTVLGLGSGGQSCANVTVNKTNPSLISIISKGYNVTGTSCSLTSTGLVERELDYNYYGNSSFIDCIHLPANSTSCPGTNVGLTVVDKSFSLVASSSDCPASPNNQCKAFCTSPATLVSGNCVVPSFSATGGTITTSGGYTIHKFTADGNFIVSGASGIVDVLIVGGGGGGAAGYMSNDTAGGGGGGAVIQQSSVLATLGSHTITVGDKAELVSNGNNGNNGNYSSALGYTAGGGGGGGSSNNGRDGVDSSSGGGGGGSSKTGGNGDSPGHNGGAGSTYAGGGGGGAGGTGAAGNNGSTGGSGIASSYSGVSVTYGCGGGGDRSASSSGGCSNGGKGGSGTPKDGVANTGGGGGASQGRGGSGIVIIRYLTPTP